MFSQIENIDALGKVFMPKIIDFTERIEQFLASHESMKECIRKFDEDISIKANKTKVDLLKSTIDDNFMNNQNWVKIDSLFSEQ